MNLLVISVSFARLESFQHSWMFLNHFDFLILWDKGDYFCSTVHKYIYNCLQEAYIEQNEKMELMSSLPFRDFPCYSSGCCRFLHPRVICTPVCTWVKGKDSVFLTLTIGSRCYKNTLYLILFMWYDLICVLKDNFGKLLEYVPNWFVTVLTLSY